jgi:hypothetical protein
MNYPRPVASIKQIEITSRCNLACSYCPHPKMARAKHDMDEETFYRTLLMVEHFCREGTQGELSLTGLGEALMHPKFPEMLEQARDVIGWNRPLVFSTNGLLLDDEMASMIAPARPIVFVSLHRPEKAGPAIEACKRAGIAVGKNNSFVDSALDWAGQVDWFVSAPRSPCEFLRSGWGVVLADGKITTCCFDADYSGVIGSVWDDPRGLEMKPYGLCEKCSDFPP